MKSSQKITLYLFSYMLILSFIISSCQTVEKTAVSDSPVEGLPLKHTRDDTQKTEHKTSHTDSTDKETGDVTAEMLIGKWQNLKETEKLEFFDDGSILINSKGGAITKMKGNYKLVDGKRLRVRFGDNFYSRLIPPMSFRVSASENEITLIDEPGGTPTTYKRIK